MHGCCSSRTQHPWHSQRGRPLVAGRHCEQKAPADLSTWSSTASSVDELDVFDSVKLGGIVGAKADGIGGSQPDVLYSQHGTDVMLS